MSDIRYAIRSLLRARWFTIAAILTFAVGIGLNAAVFSIVDRMLFRVLPYGETDSLVLLRSCNEAAVCGGAFPAVIAFEGQRRLTMIDDIAVAAMPGVYRLSQEADDQPLRLSGVSPNLLRVLRVHPVLGRDFSDEDATEKRRVGLLGHATWQRRFSGDPSVVGRTLGTGAGAITIVGVLPPDFIPPTWTAVDPKWDGVAMQTSGWAGIGPNGMIAVPVARLAEGVSIESARAEVQALVSALGPELKQARALRPGGALPLVRVDPIQESLFSRFSAHASLIAAAGVVLLLLSCANLASLLVARGRSREHTTAIHASLGASAKRLVGIALFESVLICLAGGAVALLAVALTSNALLSVLPPLFARYAAPVGDLRVLGAALAGALVCAVLTAVSPALHVARVDVLSILQRGPRGTRPRGLRGGRALLVLESALGVSLVLGGLVLLTSFTRLAGEDLGFKPEGLYTIWLRGTPPAAPLTPEARLLRYRQLIDTLAAIPDVRSAAGADSPVASGMAPMRPLTPDDSIPGARFQISAGYFETLKTPFLAGRQFSAVEVETRSPVAILNLSAARVLFPGVPVPEIIGRALVLANEPPRTVVGIVPDLKQRHNEATDGSLYLPLGAEPSNYTAAVIRMEAGKAPPLGLIQQRLRATIAPAVIPEASAMSAWLDGGLQDPRFRAVLFSVLAAAALLLAAVGLYAVSTFEMTMRRYEMGVRLSLGARGSDIRRMVLIDACRPLVLGMVIGLAGAYWTERYLQTFMYGVEPRDPAIYAAVIAILLMTALVAAWIPAQRAASVDPADVLRIA
jgi:predicted permease